MKIQFKLIFISFAVIAVLMAVVGVVTATAFQKISQEMNFIFTVVDPVNDVISDSRIAFEEEIRSIEEYASDYLTREKAEEEIKEVEAIIHKNFAKLDAAGLFSKEDLSSLQAALEREDQLREEVFELKAQGLIQEMRIGPMAKLDGIIDEIDTSLGSMRASVRAMKEARKEQASAAAAAAAVRVLMVGVIAAVLLILAMGVFVSRFIARRLSALKEVALEIAQGNMDATIDTSGKDEIGELARSIEKMRVSLKIVIAEYEKKIK